MTKKLFSVILAVMLMLAISIPSFSAAGNTALNTSQKVSFTAECNKAGYEFSFIRSQTSSPPPARTP